LILGFFGELRSYEGLEILMKAIPIILEKNINIKFIHIGRSRDSYLKYLQDLIKELNISDHVIFLNAMPHDQLIEYYSLVDMIIIPRLDNRVCRIVTPLKPLDAMGYKTLVIASDLPALRYTIIDGKTGALFKPENEKDLAAKIIYYFQNSDEKRKIEDYALEYVKKNFSWESTIPKYMKIYQKLLQNTN